jgi:HK97 gp10 family phage protein
MAARSNLEGVAELTRQLIALGKLENGAALKLAVRAGMKPVLAAAKANIPVGTEPHRLAAAYGKLLVAPGFAQSQLAIGVSINAAKNIASATVGDRSRAFYSKFAELGTRYRQATPWLRRALTDNREAAENALRDALRRAVLRAAATK